MLGFLALVMVVLVVLVGARVASEVLQAQRRPPELGADPARLERLESALSALERQVDDIVEQQRFLEGLLARRQEPGALPTGDRPPASDTRADTTEEDAAVDSILFDTPREEG